MLRAIAPTECNCLLLSDGCDCLPRLSTAGHMKAKAVHSMSFMTQSLHWTDAASSRHSVDSQVSVVAKIRSCTQNYTAPYSGTNPDILAVNGLFLHL